MSYFCDRTSGLELKLTHLIEIPTARQLWSFIEFSTFHLFRNFRQIFGHLLLLEIAFTCLWYFCDTAFTSKQNCCLISRWLVLFRSIFKSPLLAKVSLMDKSLMLRLDKSTSTTTAVALSVPFREASVEEEIVVDATVVSEMAFDVVESKTVLDVVESETGAIGVEVFLAFFSNSEQSTSWKQLPFKPSRAFFQPKAYHKNLTFQKLFIPFHVIATSAFFRVSWADHVHVNVQTLLVLCAVLIRIEIWTQSSIPLVLSVKHYLG